MTTSDQALAAAKALIEAALPGVPVEIDAPEPNVGTPIGYIVLLPGVTQIDDELFGQGLENRHFDFLQTAEIQVVVRAPDAERQTRIAAITAAIGAAIQADWTLGGVVDRATVEPGDAQTFVDDESGIPFTDLSLPLALEYQGSSSVG